MQKTIFRLVWLVVVILLWGHHCLATTDSARAYSIYFYGASDFTASADGGSGVYADRWRYWLQQHRAVERTPALRQDMLRLPQYPDGPTGAVDLMRQRLPVEFVRSQPTHVYVIQFGVYRDPQSVASFLRQKWAMAARRHIYVRTRKHFRVAYASEGGRNKSEPLFVLPGNINNQKVQRLCYGIYASVEDANRDAQQFRRIWGYSPVVLRRPLTTQLARAFIFDSVAGQLP